MRIFLSAGEASGDAVGAALVAELRKTGRDFSFEAVGGRKLGDEIGTLVADSTTWGVVSMSQALRAYPRLWRGGMKARRFMKKGQPGLFIAIDFGFFNILQCRWAKKHGWKVLSFMPPSSYNREKQGRDLPTLTDVVVTPFPWSAEMLNKMGAKAFFFGHPLEQLIRMSPRPKQAKDDRRLAVLPGSRDTELDRHLPMVADAVKDSSLTEMTLEFAVAPTFDPSEFEARWNRLAPGRHDVFTQGDVYGVLDRAQAAIVCSGTATLEAALMRCPHVVTYRISKAMEREAKIIGFKRPKFIALPNIVLDRPVVPELAGLEIEPTAILVELEPLLRPGSARDAQLSAFAEIETILGPDNAITRTAELIAEMDGVGRYGVGALRR